MLHWVIFFVILPNIYGSTVCDSKICKCERVNGGIFVDCSFQPDIFEKDFILPNTTISLDLSNNRLNSIENTTLIHSNTLQELLLNNNILEELNPNAFQVPELTKLDLSNNELESISPNFLEGIPKLQRLNLANNKLTSASELRFSSLINLKEIILDNNDLGPDLQRNLFDKNGYGLSLKIEGISMSGSNMSNIPYDYFMPLLCSEVIKNLTLSNNNLTEIFQLPYYLKYLDLSDNPIQNISSSFRELINAHTLKLNNLDIKEVPKNVFSSVIDLELERNSMLTNFSYMAFGGKVLSDFYMKKLSLKDSNFSTLDEGLKMLFMKVESLDLQGNPWICDCKLTWIRKLTMSKNVTEDLRCAAPIRLKNKRIFDLRPEDFCPKTTAGWSGFQIGQSIGILLYCMLVTITIIWIYVFLYKPGKGIHRETYTQLN